MEDITILISLIAVSIQGISLIAVVIGWYLYNDREKKRLLKERQIDTYSELIGAIRTLSRAGLAEGVEPSEEKWDVLERAYSKTLFYGSAEVVRKYKAMWKPVKKGETILEGKGRVDLIITAIKEIHPDSTIKDEDIITLHA